MSKFFIYLVTFFLPLFLFAEETKEAEAFVEEKTYDFGDVAEGVIVEHEFILKNKGNADLSIQKVVPSCGCTIAALKSNVLAPGESTEIAVNFDTNGFSGSKTKSIRVLTSDQNNSSLVLSLKGRIINDIEAKPNRLFYDKIALAEIKELKPIEVKIKINPKSKASIESVVNPTRYFEVVKQEGDAKQKRIWISPKADIQVGQIRERLLVKLSNSVRKSLNIPIYMNVTRNLQLEPSVVSFGLISSDSDLKRTIKINNYSKQAINILDYKANHQSLALELKTIKAGYNYLLNITLDPTNITEELQADVLITTDDKDNQNVTLNVFGILPNAE